MEKDGLILVTGANGFVALHIIQLLQREGYRVRGTVRSLKNESKLKPLRNLCPEAKYPVELVEADLTKDDGWDEAVRGCKYCLHVASPVPNAPPRTPEDILVPIISGTTRVLQACANAGTIKRIVLTSSLAAVHGEPTTNDEGRIYTEEEWTDANSKKLLFIYMQERTRAEKAAWDFVESLPPKQKMELCTIQPGWVLGPCINGVVCTSLEFVYRLMDFWSMPLVPRIFLPICDVRDVALAQLRVMTLPEAAGHRHMITSGNIWYPEMGKLLRKELGRYGYRIAARPAPDFLLRLAGLVNGQAKLMVPYLGKVHIYSNQRMREVLNIEPRTINEILLDTAHGLIECGAVKETRRYRSKGKTRNAEK